MHAILSPPSSEDQDEVRVRLPAVFPFSSSLFSLSTDTRIPIRIRAHGVDRIPYPSLPFLDVVQCLACTKKCIEGISEPGDGLPSPFSPPLPLRSRAEESGYRNEGSSGLLPSSPKTDRRLGARCDDELFSALSYPLLFERMHEQKAIDGR